MRSTLSEAVVRCHLRRLRTMAAGAPLPSALVGLVVLLAPLALIRVGRAVGAELAGAAGTDGVSAAIVLGPALAAAVAGAALAVSLPGVSGLGRQIAAGPCSRRVAVVAGLIVPGAVGAVTVLPSLLAACVSSARELPGGPAAGVALAAAIVAAVPAGAIVAEGGVAVVRGQRRRPLAIAGGVIAWAGIGALLGAGPLGPLAPVATALRGAGSSWLALAAAGGVCVTLALAWVELAATRAEPRARSPRRAGMLFPAGRLPVLAALAALLARRSDVRLATAGAVGFGAAGIAIAVVGGAPAPSAFLLATTTALLGAILCPLALGGLLLDGGWLWRAGPRDPQVIVGAAGLAGLAGAALPVALVGGVAASVAGASWSAVGIVTAFVVVGSAAALLAGCIVPWRDEGVGDQVVTFAAFAGIAIVTSLLVGLVAPRLVSIGLPDVVVVALVCGVSSGVALQALRRRLARAAA